MKEFEFLEKHPWFDIRRRSVENSEAYHFSHESGDDVQIAFVLIPKPEYPGMSLEWEYRYFHQGKKMLHRTNSETEIHELPKLRDKWFYDLLKEAETSLEKRDKLRKLFI